MKKLIKKKEELTEEAIALKEEKKAKRKELATKVGKAVGGVVLFAVGAVLVGLCLGTEVNVEVSKDSTDEGDETSSDDVVYVDDMESGTETTEA